MPLFNSTIFSRALQLYCNNVRLYYTYYVGIQTKIQDGKGIHLGQQPQIRAYYSKARVMELWGKRRLEEILTINCSLCWPTLERAR